MVTENCKKNRVCTSEVMFKNKMYHFFSEHSVDLYLIVLDDVDGEKRPAGRQRCRV